MYITNFDRFGASNNRVVPKPCEFCKPGRVITSADSCSEA